MKCYSYDNEIEGTTELCWCESEEEAKQCFAEDNGLPVDWIYVKRAQWADNYKSVEEIPKDTLWKHSWWFRCKDCGTRVHAGEGRYTEYGILCFDCIRKRGLNEL